MSTDMTAHVLQLVQEYGGLIRQECQFRALAGDSKYGAHVANAAHARTMQDVYYREIRDALNEAAS